MTYKALHKAMSRRDLRSAKAFPSSLTRGTSRAGSWAAGLVVSCLREAPVEGAGQLRVISARHGSLSSLGLPSLVGLENPIDLSGQNESFMA